ncbi:hypothetical protein CR513_40601, partial [Mucuna pruriens]
MLSQKKGKITNKNEAPKDDSYIVATIVTNIARGRKSLEEKIIKEGNNSEDEVANEKKEKKMEVSDAEVSKFLSKSHRKLLMEILNKAYTAHDITLDKFRGIIGNITINNYLTFTIEEILNEGKGHNKALHISMKCLDHIVVKVLIDNGSSLNMMPKSTLDRLPYDITYMKSSSIIMKTFDGSCKKVVGEIKIPIQIGPFTFEITFQVVDIKPTYSYLLGRSSIHSTGVFPSSLHQKLEFIIDDKLVIISNKKDMWISSPALTCYIKIISITYVEIMFRNPQPSNTIMMVAKVMLGQGYQLGHGLGKGLKRVAKLLELPRNKNCCRLGYKVTESDKRRMAKEKK